MKLLKNSTTLPYILSGMLCFIGAYLAEPLQGAVATFPVIIIFGALSAFLCDNKAFCAFVCAFGGFFTSCMFHSDIPRALLFALECGVLGLASYIGGALLLAAIKNKASRKRFLSLTGGIFVFCFGIYFLIHGTFFGNSSSKLKNEEYIASTYPEISFTLGSTYYSPLDACYLTEVRFIDDEIYMAKIGAKKNIDGYRDYCHARLLEEGTEKLRIYLTSKAHEHEDFALRRNRIDTGDLLTHNSSPEDYLSLMCYDIAFYREFSDSDSFLLECEKYTSYLPEVFAYGEIRFLGLDESGNFSYCAIARKTGITLSEFDKDDFVKYKNENDTSKYWDILE